MHPSHHHHHPPLSRPVAKEIYIPPQKYINAMHYGLCVLKVGLRSNSSVKPPPT